MWNDAVGYETYVGHWSRAVAPRFVAWLALPTDFLGAAVISLPLKGVARGLEFGSSSATQTSCRFPRQASTCPSLVLP